MIKKTVKVVSVFLLSFILLFSSCQNIFDSDVSEQNYSQTEEEDDAKDESSDNQKKGSQPTAPVKRYATLTGNIGLNGAYPQQITDDVENSVINTNKKNKIATIKNRSAHPTIPTGATYYVEATYTDAQQVKHTTPRGVVNNDRTYSISLEIGIEYEVIVGIEYDYGGSIGVKTLLQDKKPGVQLSETNTGYNCNFILKPLTTGGNGIIDLEMTVPSSVGDVKAECISEDQTIRNQWAAALAARTDPDAPVVSLSSPTATLNLQEIKSGCYEIAFSFLNEQGGYSLYSTVQSINVFENMTTQTWADGGSSGLISDSGTFTLTQPLLVKYSHQNIYVGNTGVAVPDNDESKNEGTPYAPFKTINRAVDLIARENISTNDYKIHVYGTQTGHFTLDDNLNSLVNSITIIGETRTDGQGTVVPPVLNGDGYGSVLSVSTTKPVTLKNIKVTGGNVTGDGGGLKITGGAKVTLDNGTLITGNTATGNGDGIYLDSTSTLSMKGSARVALTNDIYLDNNAKIKVTGTLTSDGQVAKITPHEWRRGRVVLEATSSTLLNNSLGKFTTSDVDFNVDNSRTSNLMGMLNADIYVAGAPFVNYPAIQCQPVPENPSDRRGTRAAPFATIAEACGVLNDPDFDYTIIVDGLIYGAQEIPDTVDTTARSLTIKGIENTSNEHMRFSPGNGVALSVALLSINTTKLVTIEKMFIYNNNSNRDTNTRLGGGIYLGSNAKVNLGEGVTIQYNNAQKGGCVYVSSGASLYLSNGARLGSAPSDNENSYAVYGNCRNSASEGGGGIYSEGDLYIGYVASLDPDTDTLLFGPDNSNTPCIIQGNYSGTSGGAIYAAAGEVYYNSGKIRGNGANTSGGGIYITGSASVYMTGGQMQYNAAKSGGGVYINSGSFELSTALGADEDNQRNLALSYNAGAGGGAVYLEDGSFTVSGNASIPCSSEKNNDVYLAGSKKIKVGSLTAGNSIIAKITPGVWTRGTTVLEKAGNSPAVLDTDTEIARFQTTDADFTLSRTTDTYNAFINAGLYVAGPDAGTGYGSPSDGTSARGTRASPYASIGRALQECTEAIDYEIKIAGTVTNAASHAVELSSSLTTPTKITLEGVHGNTQDKLAGNGASVLNVITAKPVVIKNLSITGGNAENGGGIVIGAGANVTLSTGALVTSNSASVKGGGVYIADTGTLTMEETSKITSNTATGTGNGGAVYNEGTFKFGGASYIPYGNTEKSNDVYLADGKVITVTSPASELTGSASGKVATITPEVWKRGKEVIVPENSSSDITSEQVAKFGISDSGWNLLNSKPNYSSYFHGYTNADIYVAAKNSDGTTASSDDTGRGTLAKPYASLQRAATECWDSKKAFTIYVKGTITGAQTIADSPAILKAAGVNLRGYIPSGQNTSDAKIDAQNAANTTALTIDTVLVDIQNITITGGNAEKGGGIYIKKDCIVNLGTGAVVQGNAATSKGGGVYVEVNDSGETALSLYGTAVIGNSGANDAPSLNTLSDANAKKLLNNASFGGGVYCEGNLYLGYKWTSNGTTISKSAVDLTGGVYANVAETSGGGIYNNAGTVTIKTGNIKYNYAETGGGALANDKTVTIEKNSTASIASNTTKVKGGAIWNLSSSNSLTIKGGTFTNNTVTNSNGTGGAIFAEKNVTITDKPDLSTASERTNDICLASDVYIAASNLTATSTIAKISPATWDRGTQVLTSGDSNITSKFAVTDSEWSIEEYNSTGVINAAIYVASTAATDSTRASTVSAASADGERRGTKAKPYKSISEAVLQCWDTADTKTKDFVINIAGTIGPDKIGNNDIYQSIPSGITKAKSITLAGVTQTGNTNAKGVIDRACASSSSYGTALKISTAVPVTITNLTITRGYSNSNGGGLYIEGADNTHPAKVNIGDGVQIYGNTASTFGGGVYVAYNAGLCVYDGAIIGYEGANAATASDDLKAKRNKVINNSGGAIACEGDLYLGYKFKEDGTIEEKTLSGGLYDNYSGHQGGAIWLKSTQNGTQTVKLKSGIIKNNSSSLAGGAITMDQYSSLEIPSGATVEFDSNSGNSGGAIYAAYTTIKKLEIQGGVFKNNTVTASGGAIYASVPLSIGGSANLYTADNAEKVNDIYINSSSNSISVISNLSNSNTNGTVGTITMYTSGTTGWVRGKDVIFSGNDEITIDENITDKFKLTDSEFKLIPFTTTGSNPVTTGRLEAPKIYVSITGSDDPNNPARGTDSSPYQTVKKAATCCWNPDTDYEIIVKDNLDPSLITYSSGANKVQEITSSAKGNSIKLKGFIPQGQTSSTAQINGTSGKPALKIATQVPITIENMKITGGSNTSGNGGGISIQAYDAKVTLSTGVKVFGNSAENGGGVYVMSGENNKKAMLIMNSDAHIYGNSATTKGGGVYLEKAYLLMSGNALIGDISGITEAATEDSKSNIAKSDDGTAGNGGGVFVDDYSEAWLGYKDKAQGDTEFPEQTLNANCGICYNYAVMQGGGILSCGKLTIKTGDVSFNGTKTEYGSWRRGGGIENQNNFYLKGGTIKGNSSYDGGGVHNMSRFYMTGGTIGDSTYPNKATHCGGGVHNQMAMWMYGTDKPSIGDPSAGSGETTAENCWNSASCGGGIYNKCESSTTTFLYIGSENGTEAYEGFNGFITSNYSSEGGGGIYSNRTAGTLIIKIFGGSFCRNVANGCGGFIFCNSDTQTTITGGNLLDNQASEGGAIFVNNVYATLNMGGSIHFASLTDGYNDICLNGSTKANAGRINVISTLTYSPTVATIKPNITEVGTPILTKESGSGYSSVAQFKSKFTLSADGKQIDDDGTLKNQ